MIVFEESMFVLTMDWRELLMNKQTISSQPNQTIHLLSAAV